MMQAQNLSNACYGRWFREKSDPPVGTGRGLKPSGKEPQCEAVRYFRAALFFWANVNSHIFFTLAIFGADPIFFNGGRKAPKRNRLAAATAGLAKNQIA
jgi:hypothetical protein